MQAHSAPRVHTRIPTARKEVRTEFASRHEAEDIRLRAEDMQNTRANNIRQGADEIRLGLDQARGHSSGRASQSKGLEKGLVKARQGCCRLGGAPTGNREAWGRRLPAPPCGVRGRLSGLQAGRKRRPGCLAELMLRIPILMLGKTTSCRHIQPRTREERCASPTSEEGTHSLGCQHPISVHSLGYREPANASPIAPVSTFPPPQPPFMPGATPPGLLGDLLLTTPRFLPGL